jgi:hypothetical protein
MFQYYFIQALHASKARTPISLITTTTITSYSYYFWEITCQVTKGG